MLKIKRLIAKLNKDIDLYIELSEQIKQEDTIKKVRYGIANTIWNTSYWNNGCYTYIYNTKSKLSKKSILLIRYDIIKMMKKGTHYKIEIEEEGNFLFIKISKDEKYKQEISKLLKRI